MAIVPKTLAALLYSTFGEEARTLAVWEKGLTIDRLDSAVWRWDVEMNLIRFDEYGKLTDYGWEIDHAVPSALGGDDQYANLRPLHWKANRTRGGLLGAFLDQARR